MASKRKASLDMKIGEWAFLVGLLLALILGIFPGVLAVEQVTAVLVVLGLVVGLVNIVSKESHHFLLAAVALLVAGSAGYGVLPGPVGDIIPRILVNITTFVAPAAVIVAVKEVYSLAKKA